MTTEATVAGIAAAPSGQARGVAAAKALKRSFAQQNWIAAAALFAALALIPVLPDFKGWMAMQASLIIIYVIAAQGISILTGYTGLVSVGHGGFLAVGAYASALMTKHWGTDLLLGMAGGMVAAAVVGCLLALVFLRLSGAFMAIGTLGFAFFIGAVVNNVPIFEGRTGILLGRNHVLGIEIGDFGFYYIALAAMALVTLFIFMLTRSGTGRAFMALRDAEKAAEASGVSRLKYRTLAFTLSAGITGLAGSLNAHIVSFLSAEVYANIWFSVDILVAAVVGGSAMLMGPLIGGLFIVMVPFFLEELADFALILKGVILIAVLMLAPAGVAAIIARPIRAWRTRQLQRASGSIGGEVLKRAEAAEEAKA